MKKLKDSTGILLYKIKDSKLLVFIVHPGGPFWEGKDEGAWSIPKGEIDNGDFSEKAMIENAIREMWEETGIKIENTPNLISLGNITQKSGKVVHAWAAEGDWSGFLMCKSYATTEWPLKSGKFIKVPEVDKAGFFHTAVAKKKLHYGQGDLVDRLENFLKKDKKLS